MAHNDSTGLSVGQFLLLIRRHAWLIAAVAVLAGGAAYLLTIRQAPQYAATAQLLYAPGVDVSNPLATQVYVDPNSQQLQILTATTMMSGPEIARRVQAGIDSATPWPPYSVQASAATAIQPGTTTSLSTGVNVTVTSTDAMWAARLANEYAKQFVKWRIENQQAMIVSAEEVLKAKLAEFTTPTERASSDYSILSERLRDLEIRAATVNGEFAIAVPAVAPTAPYAPKPTRSAVMGFAIGGLVGLGLAFLREKLDTRLRDHREVSEMLGLPILGRIPQISGKVLGEGPLVALTQADGPAGNALRILRTNLEFASLGNEHRTLMIVSALQGEGKTLTMANLATSLALAGQRVLLVDCDLRRPQVHQMFHVVNTAGVSSVMAGQVELAEAIQSSGPLEAHAHSTTVRLGSRHDEALDPSTPRLWLLTAGPLPPNPGEMIGSQRFTSLIDQLKSMSFDSLLIDSPAFLAVGDALALAANADGILLLTNLKMTKRPVLEEAKEFLAQMPAPKLGVIVVNADASHDERYAYYGDS